MKLKLNKAIWSIPVIVGGVLGLVISKPKQSQSSHMVSPKPETFEVESSKTPKVDSQEQPLDTYLLSAQSLLTKAIALSNTQIPADENAEGKTSGKEKPARLPEGDPWRLGNREQQDNAKPAAGEDKLVTVQERNKQIVKLVNEAIDTTNQAIANYPSSAQAYAQQAKIYQTITAYMPEAQEAAATYWQQAIKIDDDNPEYYTQLAELYLTRINADETAKGETSGKENLRGLPCTQSGTCGSAGSSEVGELTEVGKSEEKPARLPEGDPRRLGNRDIKLAIFYLQKAVEADPTNPDRMKRLAEVQSQAGQINQAKITYQRLLSILPSEEQKTKIEDEIDGLNKLLAQAAADANRNLQGSEGSLEVKESTKVEELGEVEELADDNTDITLPESPPKLQASDLASSNTYIAAPQDTSDGAGTRSSEVSKSNAKSGTAVIPAGEKQVEICNNNLGPNTQVYLAPQGNDSNQILFVKSKSPYDPDSDHCPNFIAGIAHPLNKNLEFKWWLISDTENNND